MAGYMGYNYSPIGSAGFGYTPPQYFQQPQQPMQQGQNQQAIKKPIQDMKFASEDEARAYIVSPNESIMFIDIPNKKFWIKSADSLGFSTFEAYVFEKYTGNEAKIEKNDAKIEISDIVRREDIADMPKKCDLRAILDKLDRVEKKLSISQIMGSETANNGVKQNGDK